MTEKNQNLDLLAHQAAAVDAASAPDPHDDIEFHSPDGQATITLAQEFKMFFDVVLPLLKPAFPSLKQIYTDDVVTGLCEATEAVCNKHGWFQGGIGGKYAEEIALVSMVAPIGYMTYLGVNNDIANIKKKQAAEASNGSDQ